MGQTWLDLLFAHWRIPEQELRTAVPPTLPIDTYDGSAWLGVTPFRVVGARPRGIPPLPYLSTFLEVNVRTYVTLGGRPGIYFLSLDATKAPAVFGARRAYRLPYFRARARVRSAAGTTRYRTRRVAGDGPSAELDVEYAEAGPPSEPRPGSLEHFLTERYCLYTHDSRGVPLRGEIHHPPWQLRRASGRVHLNTMASAMSIDLPREAPLLHLAKRQDVLVWPLAEADPRASVV